MIYKKKGFRNGKNISRICLETLLKPQIRQTKELLYTKHGHFREDELDTF